MYINFGVEITINNKAIEELSKRDIINININEYKNNNDNYIFNKIKWKTNDICKESGKAYIYYKNGKVEELQNCEDIFGEEWGPTYLSSDENCFSNYIESKTNLDINKLMELENKIITYNEVKNWIPGISAKIFNSAIEYD